MSTEQEREAVNRWLADTYDFESLNKREIEIAHGAYRAALQSQTVIDDAHLSIVLDVYDNAMQKAFEGREFPNPCKPGTPEHKAWEKGSKEGKKKRDAGLPNSIALQSQDAADMFWDADDTEDCLYAYDEETAVERMVEKAWPTDFPLHFTLLRAVRLPSVHIKVTSMSECGTDIKYEREAIDLARRVEGEGE